MVLPETLAVVIGSCPLPSITSLLGGNSSASVIVSFEVGSWSRVVVVLPGPGMSSSLASPEGIEAVLLHDVGGCHEALERLGLASVKGPLPEGSFDATGRFVAGAFTPPRLGLLILGHLSLGLLLVFNKLPVLG